MYGVICIYKIYKPKQLTCLAKHAANQIQANYFDLPSNET